MSIFDLFKQNNPSKPLKTIQFGDMFFKWDQVSRFRGIKIQIERNGTLKIITGKIQDTKTIHKFIKYHEKWIIQQLEKVKRKHSRYHNNIGLPEETYYFLGQKRKLLVKSGETSGVRVSGPLIFVSLKQKSSKNTLREIRKFYKEEAQAIIEEIVAIRSEEMNLRPQKVIFRKNTSRWGSCNSKGVVSFNWKLVSAPLKTIDYVVVHELAHLKHPNHSKEFWMLVEKFSPDYKVHSKWLRDNHFEMEFLMDAPSIHTSRLDN